MNKLLDFQWLDSFFVLEGPDGVGHTSIATALEKLLLERGKAVLRTAEPTHDLFYGQRIREILERKRERVASFLAFQTMYVIDRGQHVLQINDIIRELGSGAIVLCERYKYSTIAYGEATRAIPTPRDRRDISYNSLVEMNSVFPRPRAAFFLVADVETMRKRMGLSGRKRDIFESDESIQERVVRIYAKIAADKVNFPEVELVDASGTLEETVGLVYSRIVKLIQP